MYVPLVTRRAYDVYCMRQRLDTLFDGDLAAAVHALVSESGCSQSALEQAIRVLEEKHQETEEYDLYDPMAELFHIFYKMLVDSEISVL